LCAITSKSDSHFQFGLRRRQGLKFSELTQRSAQRRKLELAR
jgi:hypothetical protein